MGRGGVWPQAGLGQVGPSWSKHGSIGEPGPVPKGNSKNKILSQLVNDQNNPEPCLHSRKI